MNSITDCKFILSSAVRIYRNLRDKFFMHAFAVLEAEEINSVALTACDAAWGSDKYELMDINKAADCDVVYWSASNLYKIDTSLTEYRRLVLHNIRKNVSVITNEAEHILIQAITEDGNLDRAYKEAKSVLDALDEAAEYAYNDEVGYMTSDPSISGTAMKIEVLVNLSGLVITGKIAKTVKDFTKDGIEIKPYCVEKNKAYGTFYTLSNIYTFGLSAEETLEYVKEAIKKLIDIEEQCRELMMMGASADAVQNIIWRSIGEFGVARLMEFNRFADSISGLRLGAELGIIDIDTDFTDALLLYGQKGYMERYKKINSIECETESKLRARIIREAAAPVLKKLL